MSFNVNVNGQPLQLFDTNQLGIINNQTRPVNNWILTNFFPRTATFNGRDNVPLDQLKTSQPLAPFVSPVVEGRVIKSDGNFSRDYIKAPYVKPAAMVTPTTVYDIAIVDMLRSNGLIDNSVLMSPQDQLRIAQVAEFTRLREAIDNRKAMMATDILTTGKTLCVGDDFPAYEIDFGRDPRLTVTPKVKWDDPKATPVSDIEAWIDTLYQVGLVAPNAILSSSGVFNAFAKSDEFKTRFREPLASTQPSPFTPMFNSPSKAQYRGDIGGIPWYTFDAAHTLNADGTPQTFIDRTGFYLIADTQGYQAQCMIKHLKAYGMAVPYFDYMVQEDDPSTIKMICESSPVIIPSIVNGVIGGTGFIS